MVRVVALMDVIVDLPAVRPGRLARTLADEPLADEALALRPYLRGARAEDLPGGVRLGFSLELIDLATLAQLVRQLADRWPFLSFRLSAEPPHCRLDVEGHGAAAGVARAVFRELGV
jgi:hypothetical protein